MDEGEHSILASQQKKYDVFISFRGEDTRRTIVSFLDEKFKDNGIDAYIDDRLERGEEISKALLDAIDHSKFSVVIFSENYATSSWCLDELHHIMECEKKKMQIVLPVFYDVEPTNVRKQKKSYADAFLQLEDRFSLNQIQKWRTALTKAANLSGWDSSNIRKDAELVEKVVKHIRGKLKTPPSINYLEQRLVGMPERVGDVKGLLQNGSKVGISGMGGLGKTTLAEAVFKECQHQFDLHCILRNVREEVEKHGAAYLVEKMFKHLSREENGVLDNAKKKMLYQKKLLLVLDDVDNLENYEALLKDECAWFNSESKVIITSRDKQVLRNILEDNENIYDLQLLDEKEALQLFYLHAFKKKCVEESYIEISREFVDYAKGVPLALKVLGSHLFKKEREVWESLLLSMLKDVGLDQGVLKVLKISFDGLKEQEKSIFLDIACFFRGEDKYFVKDILNDGGSFDHVIGVLVDKCLLTISKSTYDEKEILEMHDLLQEMGQTIVRGSNGNYPENYSRLWRHEDIYQVLQNNTATTTIEGVFQVGGYKAQEETKVINLEPSTFTKVPHLRLLKLLKKNSKIRFEFPNGFHDTFSNQLRYLEWYYYPLESLGSNFKPYNLVNLSMVRSQLKKLWNETQDVENLKYVNLSHSTKLTCLPNLSKANLQMLRLHGCISLIDLPPIKFYDNAEKGSKVMHKYNCLMLQFIYHKVYDASSYEAHEVYDASSNDAHELYDAISYDASSNEEHDMYDASSNEAHEMYDAISYDASSNEEHEMYDASSNEAHEMYDAISYDASSNEEHGMYDASSNEAHEMYDAISYDASSNEEHEMYDASSNEAHEMYDAISYDASSNEEHEMYDANSNEAHEMYDAISYEASSNEAHDVYVLQSGTFTNIIPSLLDYVWTDGAYSCLLDLKGCSNLRSLSAMSGNIKFICLRSTAIEELHSSIGFLKNLLVLDLCNCKCIKDLPSIIRNLESLEYLDMFGCVSIKKFPKLPKSIKGLDLSRTSIQKVDSSSFECLPCLRILYMNSCTELESLPTSICKLKSLEILDLGKCSRLSFLKILEPMEKLEKLYLNGSGIEDIPSSIENLVVLDELILSNCKNLKCIPTTIWKLRSLKKLYVDGCSQLKSFPKILEPLEELEKLYLNGSGIEEIPSSIENLVVLDELILSNCKNLKSIPTTIWKLKSLKKLYVDGCSQLKSFPKILEPMEEIEKLYLNGSGIEEIPSSIENLVVLDELILSNCKNLKCIPTTICKVKSLTMLNISSCPELKSFPEILEPMENLHTLYSSGSGIEVLPPSIERLVKLEFFDICECKNLKSIPTNIYNMCSISKIYIDGELIKNSYSGFSSLIVYGPSEYTASQLHAEVEQFKCKNSCSITSINVLFRIHYSDCGIPFTCCECFLFYSLHNILANKYFQDNIFTIDYDSDYSKDLHCLGGRFSYSGNVVPKWCTHQSMDSSIEVNLIPSSDKYFSFLGFIICVVVDFDPRTSNPYVDLYCDYQLKRIDGQNFKFKTILPRQKATHDFDGDSDVENNEILDRSSGYVVIWFLDCFDTWKYSSRVDKAFFDFYFDESNGSIATRGIKQCGVRLVYRGDVKEFD